MLKFVAFTTKGLEQVTEEEIKILFPKASIINVLTKRVIFSINDTRPKELLKLKTVDDIHVLLKSFENVENLNEDFILTNLPLEQIKKTMERPLWFGRIPHMLRSNYKEWFSGFEG